MPYAGRRKSFLRRVFDFVFFWRQASRTLPSTAMGQEEYIDHKSIWPRTHAYDLSEGHTQPGPEFGAPALCWHIAVWPRHGADPNQAKVDSDNLVKVKWEDLFAEFKNKRKTLYAAAGTDDGEFNTFLVNLQKKGRLLGKHDPDQLVLVSRQDRIPEILKFDRLEPSFLHFTLWWCDDGQSHFSNKEAPSDSAIRVRVFVHEAFDHTTVSFYIDPGKPWNEDSIFSSKDATGVRRKKIFETVEAVKAICQNQITAGCINFPLLPEREVTEEQAKILHDAGEYLYNGVWGEFCQAFGFHLEDAVTSKGRCFANFRSLVMSTDGVPSGNEPANPLNTSAPGVYFHRFSEKPAEGTSEANAVIKAFWPFVRRINPEADFKEHIACGLMHWRALFITSLGAKRTARRAAEWKGNDVPAGHLLEDANTPDPTIRETFNQTHRPVRYLFLTKCEPHRRQVGRIVERMCRLGTLRLFALKSYNVIQNADIHIRIRGQELDGIMAWWSKQCFEIQQEFKQVKAKFPGEDKLDKKQFKELNEARKLRDDLLAEATDNAEKRLIEITASLDKLSQASDGGLHYRVRRSAYYIDQFHALVKILGIGDVPTWIAYNSFAERGLKPVFDLIRQTGERLQALRDRLTAVTESIQTSALVVQSSATRENTNVLRNIEWYFKYSSWGLTAWVLWFIFNNVTLAAIKKIPSAILDATKHLLGW